MWVVVRGTGWVVDWYVFFFNDTATTEIYTLSLHDALPISGLVQRRSKTEHRKTFSKCATKTRSEERFSRNAETDLVCRLLLEKTSGSAARGRSAAPERSPSPPGGPRSPAPRRRIRRPWPDRCPPPLTFSSGLAAVFFFNDTATPEIYPLSLHDALPISDVQVAGAEVRLVHHPQVEGHAGVHALQDRKSGSAGMPRPISYAVFCLKK